MLEEAREGHLHLGEITLVVQSLILLKLQPILLQVAGHVLACKPFDVHQLQSSECAQHLNLVSGSVRLRGFFNSSQRGCCCQEASSTNLRGCFTQQTALQFCSYGQRNVKSKFGQNTLARLSLARHSTLL